MRFTNQWSIEQTFDACNYYYLWQASHTHENCTLFSLVEIALQKYLSAQVLQIKEKSARDCMEIVESVRVRDLFTSGEFQWVLLRLDVMKCDL